MYIRRCHRGEAGLRTAGKGASIELCACCCLEGALRVADKDGPQRVRRQRLTDAVVLALVIVLTGLPPNIFLAAPWQMEQARPASAVDGGV